ncbi:hypothetical protein IMZ48_26630, partial [Candidatus Bathyarchaeota archaeon]|nr:hypothetical protein [Candidatus Bathyarchaeota archaeon]
MIRPCPQLSEVGHQGARETNDGEKQKEIKWLDVLHDVNALKGKEKRPENGHVSNGFPALNQHQPAPQLAPQQPPQPPQAPSQGP